MTAYLNVSSVPLSVAVFLATDNYDHESDTISATALIKPIRQIVLSARVPQEDAQVDITSMVASRVGSAIHDAIERSWKDNYVKALAALRYPKRLIDRVRINPSEEEAESGDVIPVYLEQRAYKEIMGYKISGKYDFVGEGRVEDFKTTSVNTWIFRNSDRKYILQGSIYRWLNPKIITDDRMAIQFIFTDWAAMRARQDPKYPQQRIQQLVLDLMPIHETEQYVINKLKQFNQYRDAPEEEIPLCTDEDLWRKEPEFKYYKNPQKMNRSTKNFPTHQEAYGRYIEDGSVGVVVEKPGEVVACKYCPAFPVCTQKDQLIAAGDLKL